MTGLPLRRLVKGRQQTPQHKTPQQSCIALVSQAPTLRTPRIRTSTPCHSSPVPALALPAGAAVSKWAIEYERPASAAFQVNNPQAAVFCGNCNLLLHAAMQKAGEEDDCDACGACRWAGRLRVLGQKTGLLAGSWLACCCLAPPRPPICRPPQPLTYPLHLAP